MFAIVAVIVFSAAFLLAVGTIAWMFALYHEKMVAALMFEPIPETAPVYQVRIHRRRAPVATQRVTRMPAGVLAA